jgi:hypothetical protein
MSSNTAAILIVGGSASFWYAVNIISKQLASIEGKLIVMIGILEGIRKPQ